MNKKNKILAGISVVGLFLYLTTSLLAAATYDSITSWEAFPSSAQSPGASKFLVERRVPKTITPGEEYTFFLKITNQSMYKIDHVVVIEGIPDNFKFKSALPEPSVKGSSLTWQVGMMAPRQKETIAITGVAIKPGKINHTGKAIVAYDLGSMTTVMDIIEAKLNMIMDYPANSVVGEIVPVKITLANLGTANVEDAKLSHKLSKGLKTAMGASEINEYIGTIPPNESKIINLSLEANTNGKFSENITVKAKDNIQAGAPLNITVGKPVFDILANAPKKRFVGNNIILQLNLKNKGDGIAKNTRTILNIPANTKFISATEGGILENNKLVWNVGTMKPGDDRKFSVVLIGKEISTLSTSAITTADAAASVTSNFKTEIAGIPALLISLSDVNDPVPIGGYETYIITINNQGSLAAKDVLLKCKMESAMEFIKVEGPTAKQSLENNVLILKPLPNLLPGRSATWKVTVKALKAGDVRFEVYTESKQLTRPVFENESTHFYKD